MKCLGIWKIDRIFVLLLEIKCNTTGDEAASFSGESAHSWTLGFLVYCYISSTLAPGPAKLPGFFIERGAV